MSDLNTRYAHLIALSDDYCDIIRRSQDTSLTSEEVQVLSSERSLLHNAIIEEFARVGYPVTGRTEAKQRAFNIRVWLHDIPHNHEAVIS